MVSLPQATPTVWISLVTSKKRMDGGTVHFGTTNEFSGVDLTLPSPAHMVIWMKLMSMNIATVGEKTSRAVTNCEMWVFVYYWIPINPNIEQTAWGRATLQTKILHTKQFRDFGNESVVLLVLIMFHLQITKLHVVASQMGTICCFVLILNYTNLDTWGRDCCLDKTRHLNVSLWALGNCEDKKI